MYKDYYDVLTPFEILDNGCGSIPDEGECFRLWDEYEMMEHIKGHSIMVAKVALEISLRLKQKGYLVDEKLVYATGLLHDIAKTYTIKNGGYHSQLGAVWMLDRTKKIMP